MSDLEEFQKRVRAVQVQPYTRLWDRESRSYINYDPEFPVEGETVKPRNNCLQRTIIIAMLVVFCALLCGCPGLLFRILGI